MEIVELKPSEAPVALQLIKDSFSPLLDKYKDFNHSPATKSLNRLYDEINHLTSKTYFLKNSNDIIGYVRVKKRSNEEYSISDFCIDPIHQGCGYAQFFIKGLEEKYSTAKRWSLITILEEINQKMHFVLYVKEK